MVCFLSHCHRAGVWQLGGPYLVQFGLGTGEGEGEANWKVLVLDVLLLHEVPQAVGNMVKQLPHIDITLVTMLHSIYNVLFLTDNQRVTVTTTV